MPELSINEVTTFRWTFDEDVTHYRAAGISAIGVWRQKISDFGEEEAVDLLAESGLNVSNLLWAGGFTGSCGRTYRDSLEDGLDAIRMAAALACPTLVVYSGARGGHTSNHARRLFRDALEELVAFADDFSVTLAVEPMHPGCATDWTFLTDLDAACDLLEAVNHPRAKLVFDAYHFGLDVAADRLTELAPHIAVVHLGDAQGPPSGEQNRVPLGEGAVPLKQIAEALAAGGYDGYYDVELIGENIEQRDYHELLTTSRQAFEQLVSVHST